MLLLFISPKCLLIFVSQSVNKRVPLIQKYYLVSGLWIVLSAHQIDWEITCVPLVDKLVIFNYLSVDKYFGSVIQIRVLSLWLAILCKEKLLKTPLAVRLEDHDYLSTF